MSDADAWLIVVEQHITEIIESLQGTLTFQDLKAIVFRVRAIVHEATTSDGPTTRSKVIAVVEYIIDHTNTPWLNDDMSDPFMKAMVPSLVDYVLDTPEAESGPDLPSAGPSGCLWQKCGAALFRC